MKTTDIKYGKILSVIQTENNKTKIYTEKVFNLDKIVSNIECFSMQLSLSKLNKTIKNIEALGFKVEKDLSYGFEFECKIYCNLIY